MKKIDVTQHVLVPKHSKLSDKDKQELLASLKITEANLPLIKKGDSAIAELGAKPGDVIKIARASPTAGEALFYRVVSSE